MVTSAKKIIIKRLIKAYANQYRGGIKNITRDDIGDMSYAFKLPKLISHIVKEMEEEVYLDEPDEFYIEEWNKLFDTQAKDSLIFEQTNDETDRKLTAIVLPDGFSMKRLNKHGKN